MNGDTCSKQHQKQKQHGPWSISFLVRGLSRCTLDLYFRAMWGKGNRMSYQLNRCILRRKWCDAKNIATNSPNLATVRDKYGYTPLHHIIRVYHDGPMTTTTPQRQQPNAVELDAVVEHVLHAFPEAAVTQSNNMGWTPLHFAVHLNLPSHIIKRILEVMPQAVNIPSNDGKVPIFLSRLKRKRTLWEIRTKRAARDLRDRYRQEWRTVMLLLQASAHGSVSVRRRASDNNEFRILHAACATPCPSNILNVIIKLYPEQAKEQDADGNFPLSIILLASNTNTHTTTPTAMNTAKRSELLIDYCRNECMLLCDIIRLNPEAVRTPNFEGRLPLHIALGSGKMRGWHDGIIQTLMDLFPESIDMADPKTGLFPFMLAGCSSNIGCMCPCIDTVYQLLRRKPELVKQQLPGVLQVQ